MPEWLLWALAVVLAVAAGWAWTEWRHRSATRRPAGRAKGPERAGTRPGKTAPPRGRTRSTTPPRPRSGAPEPADPPAAGEIWWADVPYADGSGSKVRPCLVLRVDGRGADVLKITSQDKSDRDDHVRIPTRDWDPDAEHDSFVNLTEPVRVPIADFANHAGACDPALWRQIRRLPHLPTAR
ncbi:type II toxin-antitoxin system PemK/MazF family toxin [Micromonospora endolithica]|uniref:Type II toxin-antitoxin system PemK/MazF family toxin n=1 Tax=Micromonospora endolithica TaxID=230091 RepID=A0A3A9ZN17_9ACTN|nr:type II toxin-antitoxin system PemK/MazF family toxin [Micromonospora endolithica]RKN49663.1 type II toxin-antitoxin system PemK/MazF family toxin [Micromonospora endolithica]TWJ23624.1 PemK-like, MazF-like toxin of type II toxin-antitoxin system [Micromonospora endolithica]